MTSNAPVVLTRKHLNEFFSRVDPVRGRLIFAVDATASRQPTWDMAAHLQTQMFATAGAIANLDVQLVHFRGEDEFRVTAWLTDPKALADIMRSKSCAAGHTQISKVLAHARNENLRGKVNALILISDACEEAAFDLYAKARELGDVPVFLFQEGADERVGEIYAEIAKITGGAVAKFDSGAAQRLADLLRAVAAFASGGIKALAGQKTEAARLLLTQVKKGPQ